MKKVETLTLNETLDLFRAYGVSMSYDGLVALIDSDKVRWAISARNGGSGNIHRKIFRKPLVEWLDAMAEEDEAV